MSTAPVKVVNETFSNKNTARVVIPGTSHTPENIIEALGISNYKSIIIVLGSADTIDMGLIPRLTQLFDRGIARAAAEAGAVVIDGGIQVGVMKLMGRSNSKRETRVPLVGVTLESKVSYQGKNGNGDSAELLEPNHSHFVLVEGQNWGDETSMMFDLVKSCMHRIKPVTEPRKKSVKTQVKEVTEKLPCIALLAGGGPVSKEEVLYAIRRNIPLIVVEGSGGLADEVAKAFADKTTLPDDPGMAEIIADGDIHIHPLNSSVKGIERLIIRELGVDKVLMQAWETFAIYNDNAGRKQNRFHKLQKWIIWIGIIGTGLAIFQQLIPVKDANGEIYHIKSIVTTMTWQQKQQIIAYWIIYYLLLIIPISLTVLLTISSRFRPGNKWLLLRAGAESIKREIYRYRVRSGNYSKEPEKQLSLMVEDITRRTMRTEVNAAALVPYNGAIPPDMFGGEAKDDGLSYLSPDRYVEVRLSDQISYFTRKTQRLEKQLKIFTYTSYVIGGIGTLLVALEYQWWLPLTTALVTGIATFLGYRQTENTLIKYNQIAADLTNVRAWWNALSAEEQAQSANIDSLVDHTEQVLESEMNGWVQQMQNALDNLRKPEEKPKDKETEEEEEKDSNDTGGQLKKAESKKEEPAKNRNTNKASEGAKKGEQAVEEEPVVAEEEKEKQTANETV